ncbi:MAG: hypothetical protein M3Y21_06895 [Candidatus Eremiobacteraeota bacterium]|nr:hypothetical protein [Candidatus Eremiobacteraeota bacterium]
MLRGKSALRWIAPLAAAVIACMPSPGRSAAQSSFDMTAQTISLYADRRLLSATGAVTIQIGSRTVACTRAVYDIAHNRLTADGNVSVTENGATRNGRGYTYDPSTSKQHLFTAATDDPKTFTVPDFAGIDPFITANRVTVFPLSALQFTSATLYSGGGASSVSSYTYSLVQTTGHNFGTSPLAQNVWDVPYTLYANDKFWTVAHGRFDQYGGKVGYGIEQRYARSDRGSIGAALTRDLYGPRVDLVAFQQMGTHLSQSLSGTSVGSTTYARYALVRSGRRGATSLVLAQYGGSQSDDVFYTTNDRTVGRWLTYHVQGGVGRDVHPNNYPIGQDFRTTFGLHLSSASVQILKTSLSSSFDLSDSLYAYGRDNVASTLGLWATRAVGRKLFLTANATFAHYGDLLRTNQRAFYPLVTNYTTGDGSIYPGYAAYDGASIYRSYFGSLNYQATPRFTVYTSLAYANDFPQYRGYGRMQYVGTIDLHIMRKRGGTIEFGRIEPFGWAGQRYRGSWILQLTR